jgi:hypothetical protein
MAATLSAAQNGDAPIIANPNDWTNGMNKAGRDVAWYQNKLNTVPEVAMQIFREYSGIPEDEIMDHIHRVRDKAWDM